MTLQLLVKGTEDLCSLVWMLLDRAKLPLDRIKITGHESRAAWIDEARRLADAGEQVAVLFESDGFLTPRAREGVAAEIERTGVTVFFASPNVEAWIVQDPDVAVALKSASALVGNLARDAPGQVPNAAAGAPGSILEALVGVVDVDRAAAMNASLRAFLSGVSGLLGLSSDRWLDTPGTNMPRDIIAGLIREVPPEEVVWRTSSGTHFTSSELVQEVLTGTDLGRQYASDLLRVARDLLARRSKRA